MHPKPPPPTSLLLPGQQWTIVPSVHWELTTGNQWCYWFDSGERYPCGAPAVVKNMGQVNFTRDGLCIDHMGSHQWVNDEGVLVQWRAEPPYINKVKPKYERWRRGKGSSSRSPGEGS